MTHELSPALADSASIDLDWIMAELDDARDDLPEEAILAARQAPQLVVPRLISAFRAAVEAARENRPLTGNAHFFAFFLLAEFRAKEALPLILEALSLPEGAVEDLLGDACTAYPERVLLSLADDPLPLFDQLIGNRNLYSYTRWSGVSGYRYLVRDGRLSRGEAVERLRAFLRAALDAEDAEVIDALLSELSSYQPREVLDEIHEAFSRELVDTFMVDEEEFDLPPLSGNAEPSVDFGDLPASRIDDTLAELGAWAVFQDDSSSADSPPYEHSAWTSPARDRELPDFAPTYDPPPTERLVAPRRIGRNDPAPAAAARSSRSAAGPKGSRIAPLAPM